MRLASAVVVLALGLALAAAHPAGAHVSVSPPFLSAGETQTLVLSVHNDRDETMTGFRLVVPDGFRIASAGSGAGWRGAVSGRTATWSCAELPPDTPATFEVALAAPAVPGPAVLEGNQLYPDGGAVRWPVSLTVVPAGAAGDDGLLDPAGVVVLALLGLVVLTMVAIVLVVRGGRRNGLPLQD